MRYKVRSDDRTAFAVCADGSPESVLQNVALLLNTRAGTVPSYRDFGLPFAFEHMPTEAMRTAAAVEVAAALARFEPRAAYVDLEIEVSENHPALYVMIVEVEI